MGKRRGPAASMGGRHKAPGRLFEAVAPPPSLHPPPRAPPPPPLRPPSVRCVGAVASLFINGDIQAKVVRVASKETDMSFTTTASRRSISCGGSMIRQMLETCLSSRWSVLQGSCEHHGVSSSEAGICSIYLCVVCEFGEEDEKRKNLEENFGVEYQVTFGGGDGDGGGGGGYSGFVQRSKRPTQTRRSACDTSCSTLSSSMGSPSVLTIPLVSSAKPSRGSGCRIACSCGRWLGRRMPLPSLPPTVPRGLRMEGPRCRQDCQGPGFMQVVLVVQPDRGFGTFWDN